MKSGETISAEVARRMRVLGLSKKGLSLKAGLGATYVRDILVGRSKNPKSEQIKKLYDTLDQLEAEARASKRGRA